MKGGFSTSQSFPPDCHQLKKTVMFSQILNAPEAIRPLCWFNFSISRIAQCFSFIVSFFAIKRHLLMFIPHIQTVHTFTIVICLLIEVGLYLFFKFSLKKYPGVEWITWVIRGVFLCIMSVSILLTTQGSTNIVQRIHDKPVLLEETQETQGLTKRRDTLESRIADIKNQLGTLSAPYSNARKNVLYCQSVGKYCPSWEAKYKALHSTVSALNTEKTKLLQRVNLFDSMHVMKVGHVFSMNSATISKHSNELETKEQASLYIAWFSQIIFFIFSLIQHTLIGKIDIIQLARDDAEKKRNVMEVNKIIRNNAKRHSDDQEEEELLNDLPVLRAEKKTVAYNGINGLPDKYNRYDLVPPVVYAAVHEAIPYREIVDNCELTTKAQVAFIVKWFRAQYPQEQAVIMKQGRTLFDQAQPESERFFQETPETVTDKTDKTPETETKREFFNG